MPLVIGQLLNNRYRIVALLGQGGMGAVYRAWDMRLNLAVAVKENLDPSPEAERQFSREAQILARLSHPNLTRVTDHFTVSGQGQYLIMDFVEGEDLESKLNREGMLPEAGVLPWLLQICDALTYLHNQSPPIIHRDIKPANIRLRPDGRALLVNFGIAKIYDPAQATTLGAKAVTPGFSALEQYSGHTDARSDVYSLGATLYTLLTGQTLPESVLRAAHQQSIVPPRQHNALISRATEQVIIQALEIDAARRPQTVEAFRAALTAPSVKQPSVTRPTRRWAFVALVATLALITIGTLFFRPSNSLVPSSATEIATTSPAPTEIVPTAAVLVAITPARQPTATSVPTTAPLVFAPIDLGPMANASLLDDYAEPPVGRQILSSVPFEFNERVFKSQARPAPDNTYPTRAVVEVDVSNVEQVYVLISAGDAFTRWRSKTVGRITLVFETGANIEVDLVLGQNLREWHAASNVVSTAPQLIEVWQGPITGSPDLSGTLDMLTLEVPADRRSAKLKQIEFDDLSLQTVGSQDPSMTITGVTVAHR